MRIGLLCLLQAEGVVSDRAGRSCGRILGEQLLHGLALVEKDAYISFWLSQRQASRQYFQCLRMLAQSLQRKCLEVQNLDEPACSTARLGT